MSDPELREYELKIDVDKIKSKDERNEPSFTCMGVQFNLAYVAMAALFCQTTVDVLFSKHTTSRDVPRFENASAVIMCEVMKLTVCLSLIFMTDPKPRQSLYSALIGNWKDMLKMAVPSLIYCFQNFLQLVAISNLSASVYTVTFQSKVLVTAVVSMLIFGRRYSCQGWLALTGLAVGVAMVQLGKGDTGADDTSSNYSTGIFAALLAVNCSAVAGVWMEMMLKEYTQTLWVRNVQLASWALLASFATIFFSNDLRTKYQAHGGLLGTALDEADSAGGGLLYNFDGYVWAMVAIKALGGLLAATVLKYANAVLKGMSVSASVVMTTVISSLFLGAPLAPIGILGVLTTSAAIQVWSRAPKVAKSGAELSSLPRSDSNV